MDFGAAATGWLRLRAALLAFKAVFLSLFVVVTNAGFSLAVAELWRSGSFSGMALFAGVWTLALAGLVAVVLERRVVPRIVWGFLIAASGAFAWGYFAVSQRPLDVFGILLMWDARNFSGNAAANHAAQVRLAIIFGFATWFVLALPSLQPARRGLLRFTALVPVLPIAAIAFVVSAGEGRVPAGFPTQFTQGTMALQVTYKNYFSSAATRLEPAWKPDAAKGFRSVVVLIDESIRPDYLDPRNLSGATPHFAEAAKRMVDFGAAASSSVCSSYSNAMLRFTAARGDVGRAINRNPLLFSFAQRAGYRTVYIDAQAHALKNSDLMQNFMSKAELKHIDNFYPLTGVGPAEADHRLAEIVIRELAAGDRVFIYANKQGAHFPYDINYPPGEAVHHPTVSELGAKTYEANIASYRNAIVWNVDRFFATLFERADLRNAYLVYTSDHGQSLDPTGLAHCAASKASPRMGLVPLYAYADDGETMRQLAEGARLSQGRASHFQIVPSLLTAMGYAEADVMARYTESLTAGTRLSPAFTMGDIFGLFSPRTSWMGVDLNKNYVEAPLGPPPDGATASLSRVRR